MRVKGCSTRELVMYRDFDRKLHNINGRSVEEQYKEDEYYHRTPLPDETTISAKEIMLKSRTAPMYSGPEWDFVDEMDLESEPKAKPVEPGDYLEYIRKLFVVA